MPKKLMNRWHEPFSHGWCIIVLPTLLDKTQMWHYYDSLTHTHFGTPRREKHEMKWDEMINHVICQCQFTDVLKVRRGGFWLSHMPYNDWNWKPVQVRGVDQTPYQSWHSPLRWATSYAHEVAPLLVESLPFVPGLPTHTHKAILARGSAFCLLRSLLSMKFTPRCCWLFIDCQNTLKATASWNP